MSAPRPSHAVVVAHATCSRIGSGRPSSSTGPDFGERQFGRTADGLHDVLAEQHLSLPGVVAMRAATFTVRAK
jgi:hypothetical protein